MQQNVKKHAGHGIKQVELLNYLLNNLSQFNLKPTAKLVLMYLAGCYNPKHADVFPKQKTIACQMGISEASVIRAIQELHKEGLIVSERKYTNRYKFTSKILNLSAQDEDFLQDNKMQGENLQNDLNQTCNLQSACIEQQEEQLNEQKAVCKEENSGNTYEMEDYKILKSYAEQNGAKNVKAYVNSLISNGAAAGIIKKAKEIKALERHNKKVLEDTQNLLVTFEEMKKDNAAPADCKRLQEVLWAIKSGQ